ncbi:MAG: radical SAM protein, partial [Deltaproteobacteria bacterium]|nr:radical SAM protein [Deltaproteobacteria bacterium]
AHALKEAGVDGAMIDIIGDNETIRKVYHLKRRSVEDYERSLELLVRHGLSVIPHIVIGLHYGKILGEYRALEMIRRYQISALILVILMPIFSTPMFGICPPPLERIGDIFYRARLDFPKTPVQLGCARPMGNMMKQTDTLAVDSGLNGIAYPAPGVVAYARQRGLVPEFHETCCSIYE